MQLVVQSGAEPGRTYDITASQKIRMGRQSGNDVVVPDEQVSRRHAEIEERNGGLVVTDLGSSNGTFVNGTRIASPQSLQAGDTVQVGTTVLKVLGAAPASMGAGDYDQGGATQVSFNPTGQDNSYGNYGSPAAPSSPAAPAPTDYGQGAYGQSAPSYGQPQSYDPAPNYSQGSYGQQQAPTDYGQGQGAAYNQQPAAYDQGGQGAYGQAGSYGQPAAGAYDQGQAAYGQPQGGQSAYDPAPGAYGQPQAYDPQAAYGQQQAAYDPQYGGQAAANAYGQPGGAAYPAYGQAAAPVVAKKGGLPLPLLLIGGVVVLLIIIALVYFLVINKSSGTVGADIPEPKNSTKLNISIQDFEKFRQAGDTTDISKASFAGYTSTDTPDAVASFYRTEMKNRGWTEDVAGGDATSLLFKKGDTSAGVSYQAIKTQTDADAFGAFFPAIKDQVKVGQTLIFLVSGPTSALTTPKK